MTSEPSTPGGSRWLLEPPGPQEISLHFAAGENAEITDEIQHAFEKLIQTLGGDDVRGFAPSPKCGPLTFTCTPDGRCTVESQSPLCEVDYHCKIAVPGSLI